MDKREAIMEAALELFAERGFHGTSVSLIAEKARAGAGTIYRYFKDKETLVNALFQRWKGTLSESVLSGLQEDLPPRRLFHEIWQRMLAFSEENPNVLKFLEFHHHAPYLDEESRLLCDRVESQFDRFYEVCRRQEVTQDVAPEVLRALVKGVFTSMIKEFMTGEIEPSAENATLFEELCWQAVRR
jgi:AcrR family transcriptional regulator